MAKVEYKTFRTTFSGNRIAEVNVPVRVQDVSTDLSQWNLSSIMVNEFGTVVDSSGKEIPEWVLVQHCGFSPQSEA